MDGPYKHWTYRSLGPLPPGRSWKQVVAWLIVLAILFGVIVVALMPTGAVPDGWSK